MKIKLLSFTFFLLVSSNLWSQTIENLKLTKEDLPKEYSSTEKSNCVAIQSCLFYKQTGMYSAILGKVKNKEVQNFESSGDNGSIMYFEFEEDFTAQGFLEGLLWGQSDKPTTAHPEEYYVKGKMLIVWSLKKDSPLKTVSKEKVLSVLK